MAIEIIFRDELEGDATNAKVSSDHPFPVRQNGPLVQLPALVRSDFTATVSTTAYTTKDALGGLLAFNVGCSAGFITAVTVIDLSGQAAAEMILVGWDRPFAATADNAAFDPADVDARNAQFMISMPSTDFRVFSDWGMGTTRCSQPFVNFNGGNVLYAQIEAIGTPTYALGEVVVKLHIQQGFTGQMV